MEIGPHYNIVRVYGVANTKDYIFIVLELCLGNIYPLITDTLLNDI